MKNSIFLLLLFFPLLVTAQKFEITGTLVDKETEAPLESATIFVERIADSSLVTYTITDNKGLFVLEGSDSADSLRLVSSYAGYSPFNTIVNFTEREIDLGTLEMSVANNLLGEVMVVSNRAPVTIKSDTLEFNADSFNTRPDANLEELMKKLPGVEVDAQGTITVNGKSVSRILVNGTEFFGNDPKIATKNLPREIIDKIQVIDTKTKEEEFTGKAGDPDNKTINITIKEDRNKGYFSRATLGGGTDERYELNGIGNYFNNDLRVSVLASSNNINSTGFSFDDVYGMMGGRGRGGGRGYGGGMMGGGGGITKSEAAGLNFTNRWGRDLEGNASYFFGRNDTESRTEVERENFLPDRTYYSNSLSAGNAQNDSHRANASIEFELDTLTRISIQPSINITDGFSNRLSTEETRDESRELVNSSETFTNGIQHSSNFDNQANFIRRFGNRGAYIQADFSNGHSRSENENLFESERITYEDNLEEVVTQNQRIAENNSRDSYRFGLTQRSVLSDKLFLDLSYDFDSESSENERTVLDLNDITGEYSEFNEDLSNAFEMSSVKHIPNVGVNYEGEKWNVGFDVGLLHTSLKNDNLMTGNSFDRSFNNLYVNSRIRYELARGSSARVSYRSNTSIPSIRQMQPVADRTNPLNIVVGNPELRPTYSHSINLSYNNFDYASRSGLGTYASFDIRDDEVVSVTLTDEDLVRTTTYTNVDGSYSGSLGVYYNKRFKRDSVEYSYRLSGNANLSKNIGFSNGVQYSSKNFGFGPSVGLGFNYKELFDINPRYSLNYSFRDYGINNSREEDYINHSVGIDATSYWPENVIFGNDFSYNYYGSVAAAGFDPTSILWNMSLGYQFLDNDATLKIKVYDLLNENVSTSRITGQDFVQDTQSLILEQYFMLSFTYKFSNFGGREPNRRGRRGRVMRW